MNPTPARAKPSTVAMRPMSIIPTIQGGTGLPAMTHRADTEGKDPTAK